MKFEFFDSTITTMDIDKEPHLVLTVEINYDGHVIVEDDFGRKWKLIPVQNKHILSPFVTKPLPVE